MFQELSDPKKRMNEIIKHAYSIFCKQVAGGVITLENEASMQLHLSNILLQLGRLCVYKESEHFSVCLEKKTELLNPTNKSNHKKARIDIWLELKDNGKIIRTAAIELKCFKTLESGSSIPVTNKRQSVYEDLENLEQYSFDESEPIIYEIVYTDDPNFSDNKELKYNIADGTTISSHTDKNKDITIKLSNKYPCQWINHGHHYFLKLTPEKLSME